MVNDMMGPTFIGIRFREEQVKGRELLRVSKYKISGLHFGVSYSAAQEVRVRHSKDPNL